MDDSDRRALDWQEFLKQREIAAVEEIQLASLAGGDRLRVVTQNSTYDFVVTEGRKACLNKGREDRPFGDVYLMGCTFGQSSTIKPDSLFCGGNLEFTFEEGKMTHTTTAIKALFWVHHDRADNGTKD